MVKNISSITQLPELTSENLRSIMAEQIRRTESSVTSIPTLWQGMLEMRLPTDAGSRTAKLYIPRDTAQGTTFVFLNVPDGQDTLSFLVDGGWIACSEKHGLPIFAAEPGPAGWGEPDHEQPYIDACAAALFRGIYVRAGMSVYVVGYGTIGKCMHAYAMNAPLRVAAAVFTGASDLEEHVIRAAEAGTLDTDEMKFDIPKRDIPVPVWIAEKRFSASAQRAAAHWIHAVSGDDAAQAPTPGEVYTQSRKSVCTPAGPIAQVRLSETDEPPTTDEICAFLRRYSRYNKAGPYGNSLVPRLDYREAGIDVQYYPDASGKQREYLIYVPKGVRKKMPMVLAIHGYSESVRNYMEESLWYRKAEKEGFIVVMPETTLYPVPPELSGGAAMACRPRWGFCSNEFSESAGIAKDDLNYLNHVMDEVIAAYPVDETRVYCTGHSNGMMMTSLFASTPFGSRFAAAAATSGITSIWDSTGTACVPVYFTMGEYDLWPYTLEAESSCTKGIDLWLIRNGLARESNVREVRRAGASESFTVGRHHCTQWKNKDGIPLVRYDWIEMKDHMNTADENDMFWDRWFSKWSLEPGKGRCYNGKPI